MLTGIIFGMCFQLIALLLVFYRVGRRWTSHIGALFIVMACIYHGLGEILIQLFPEQNPYRSLVKNPADLDEFVILVSATILIFTMAYLIILGHPEERSADSIRHDLSDVESFFDWRLMVLLALPFLILTAQGSGYTVNGASTSPNGSLSVTSGLSFQFLLLLVPLASFSLIVRFGRKSIPWVLLGQSLLIALVGQRLEIFVGILSLLYALGRYNIRIPRRTVIIGVVVVASVVLIMTSTRANSGRAAFSNSTGVSAKVDALATGVLNVGSSATAAQFRLDAGYRLDGNSWGALVLQSLHSGIPPAGPGSMVNDVKDAVPSFINPTKNTQSVTQLSETSYQGQRLQLPTDPGGGTIGVTPTQLGTILGYWGIYGLLIAGSILGLLFAYLDRWLLKGGGFVRLIVGLGMVVCVAFYERSNITYTTTLRGVLVVAVLVKILHLMRVPNLLDRRRRDGGNDVEQPVSANAT